ncbi:MAG: GDYXXLXY domain-containing protein [Rhodoferax sp.]|nr:GDYXXLXY domain-containing protein [Rhodoferax sp.]MDP3650824.1 GDYXXLXY domain-containing protein [Rhodoferax sp.]
MSPNADPRLQAALDAAVQAGLLPANTPVDKGSERPWPVVLLTALGAWFAAVPLLLAIGMLLGDMVRSGAGPYVIGCLVLGASIVVMRSQGLPLFVEQLAVPALLVGGGTLAMGVYRDFSTTGGSAILLVVALGLALVLPQVWLRVLLGALAANLMGLVLLPHWHWGRDSGSVLLVLHGLLAVWLLALWLQERMVAVAALVESLAAGWLLTTVVGLTYMAGSTFLVGGAVGSNEIGAVAAWLLGFERGSWQAYSMQIGSSILVLAAAGVGALAWPSLRQLLPCAVALVLAVLAWFMPMLGAVLLALMVCASTQRWRLASACALAASWILGAFYYQLQWPLADKALLLVGAGAVLAALAWLGQRTSPLVTSAGAKLPLSAPFNAGSLTLLAGTLLTVLVANGAIWQKQDLIAHGKPLFMALVPVDPRSLMQGDYMRLRFATLDTHTLPLLEDLGGQRPHMVVQRDARGVGTVQRLHTPTQPLAPNEMLLQLTPKDGDWVVVTDAWFFTEGQGPAWQAAKFGEFRVLPDGRALLVGLADAALQPIPAERP